MLASTSKALHLILHVCFFLHRTQNASDTAIFAVPGPHLLLRSHQCKFITCMHLFLLHCFSSTKVCMNQPTKVPLVDVRFEAQQIQVHKCLFPYLQTGSDTQRRQEEKTATQDTPTPQADQPTNKDGSEKRKRTQRRTHFRARISAFFSCSRYTSAFARVRLRSFASVRLRPHPCVYVRVRASTFASVCLRPRPCVRVHIIKLPDASGRIDNDASGRVFRSRTFEMHYMCTCMDIPELNTRNTHAQWALHQVYDMHLRRSWPNCARTCQLTTFLIVTDTYMYICIYIMKIDPSFRASC